MTATAENMTYGDLFRLLRDTGFAEQTSERGITFRHPSEALLPFSPVAEAELIRLYHLVATRATLNDYDILPADSFDIRLIRLEQGGRVPA
ncbi:MAG: hypothetical protein H7145_08470 [Akkermansiaceae bacterium]|nr:hypothetical protein [Armatimonadota bacterium]